jgi:DNA-directed RNA polymerase specialized sigma24 family protein
MGDSADLLALHRDRLRALPLKKLRAQLILKAARSGASEAVAEDLAQGALLKLWTDGADKWDYERDPTAYLFLIDEMRERRKSELKKKSTRWTTFDTEAAEAAPPSSDRGAVRSLLDREEATRAREELLRRLAVSPLTLRVAELCIAHGALTAAEVAERLEVDVKRIYDCQRRISREVKSIEEQRAVVEEEASA